MFFDDLCELCKSKERLMEWLGKERLLGDYHGSCQKCNSGTVRVVKDGSYPTDGVVWRCTYCARKISIRRNSWFAGSHLTLQQIMKLTYLWVWRCDQRFIMRECHLGSNTTIVDWCNFAREVCVSVLETDSKPIGGPGTIVEIDESKFGRRKYHRGRRVDGVWVFGGIERGDRGNCFMVTVEDRSAATLIPIIKKYILPGSKIMSDCWKAYDCLENEGYIHGTVNHSIEFINSETGDHTQSIESTWRAVKKSLPRSGSTKGMYDSYFAEFIFR